MSNWYMPCPKCKAPIHRSIGDWYSEDVKINSTWRTVKKRKINYDCLKCGYTRMETEVSN